MKGSTIVLALGVTVAYAHADVTSRFDSDIDGWGVADVSTSDLSIIQSGSPTWENGHIKATEFGSQLFVYAGPTKFLGDKLSYYGGSVSFTLGDTVSDNLSYPNLLLRGNGIAIAYVTPPPTTLGTSYTIPLTATGWIDLSQHPVSDATFRSVLSNLDRFGINADWKTLGTDVTTLDDVVLAQPVPEPSALAAFGLGLLAFVRCRRS